MPQSSVTIDLKGRDVQLQSKLKRAGASIYAFAQKAGQAIQRLNRRFMMLGGIVGGIALAAVVRQSQAEKKLEGVLRATGGAAGYTFEQLKKMATQLQLLTNYGDETTLSAMGILASFKQIKGNIFREAIKAAQDMSAVMGTNLTSSILQVGKALNDPIIGATMLRRVGVSLTEQQMEQIKAFVKSNQLMRAQGVILAELKGEFGGAAEAMAEPLIQLKNNLGDIAEVIGSLLQPAIAKLSKWVHGAALEITKKDSVLKENLATLGKWALAISGAIIIIPRLIALLTAYIGMIKAITGAQTLMLALSGPKGWAVLAAGVVVAVGAIAGLEIAWRKVTESAKAAEKASEAAVQAAGKAGRGGYFDVHGPGSARDIRSKAVGVQRIEWLLKQLQPRIEQMEKKEEWERKREDLEGSRGGYQKLSGCV